MDGVSPDAIVVFISAANKAEANRIAETLLEKRLAACVQILPGIESIYRWQGKVERAPEVLLIAKTMRAQFPDLEREVRVLHSYETPEIVATAIVAGSNAYLDWISESLGFGRNQD